MTSSRKNPRNELLKPSPTTNLSKGVWRLSPARRGVWVAVSPWRWANPVRRCIALDEAVDRPGAPAQHVAAA